MKALMWQRKRNTMSSAKQDDEANQLYLDMLEEENDGLYIQDIMRGGVPQR